MKTYIAFSNFHNNNNDNIIAFGNFNNNNNSNISIIIIITIIIIIIIMKVIIILLLLATFIIIIILLLFLLISKLPKVIYVSPNALNVIFFGFHQRKSASLIKHLISRVFHMANLETNSLIVS